MTNAICRLLQPLATPLPGDMLEREHRQGEVAELRCWLAKMTSRQEAIIAGQAAISMWECRLVVPREMQEQIREGWRLEAKLDCETMWHEYRVTRVASHYHLALTVERVS
jgi:hypothetical protein